MSTLRFFREAAMLLAVISGAAIGFIATRHMEPTVNMVCSFLGMASFGALADLCIRGGR